MGITSVDGIMLRKMIIAGCNEITRNKNAIDELNVFPVPDGDTGTNMSKTVQVAAKEVETMNTPNAHDVAKAASNGSLRGARGNSGVILSQLFRGFAKGVEHKPVLTADDIALAFLQASETAYKAVMKPKEGTILTVAAAMAERATEIALDTDDIELLLTGTIRYGNEMLEKTTAMLPELTRAGVVDAGGMGLMALMRGACASIHQEAETVIEKGGTEGPARAVAFVPDADITFGYCTEFFVDTEDAGGVIDRFREYLDTLGDSIVVVGDESIIKVHVHTDHPGKVLEYALKIGPLSNLKIDNMRLQHSSLISFVKEKPTPPKAPEEMEEMGFVAIAPGGGIAEYFSGLGVDIVIEGGQTMNPSTDDILAAIDSVHARNIFVLPNNKNIILAANQAAEMTTGKTVRVIPTKTIPQGVTAMVEYLPIRGVDENFECMKESVERVKSGRVTFAARNSSLDGCEIAEGDILCLLEDNIAFVESGAQAGAENAVLAGAKRLLDEMLADGGDIMGVFCGEDAKQEWTDGLCAYIEERYPDVEIECRDGGQPLYYYIFSVE